MNVIVSRKTILSGLLLLGILVISFSVRIAGIQRKEPIDYHPDEWVLAQPIYSLANQGQVGLKTHYKWSGCGVIYPVGHFLYFLKPVFKEYSYETILRILRYLSAITSVGAVLAVFWFLYHYHSVRAAYIGAVLLGISKHPAICGHYATLDSITILIAMLVLIASYRIFHLPDESETKPLSRNLLLGLLIGWAIAVKWTFLLSAIPLFVAFVSAFICAVRSKTKAIFFNRSIQQCVILGLGLVLGFLVFFPDIQLVPNKVKEGLDYEIEHHKTGHYGSILSDAGTLGKRIQRTYKNFVICGWKVLAITGLCSIVFVFFNKTPLKWYIFYTFLLWTYVPFRNLVSPPRHYLVPYTLLLLLLALTIDHLLNLRNRYCRAGAYISASAIVLVSLLYTCVCVSTFWLEDPRVACAKWAIDNVPEGSGVTWAPRHQPYNWAVPGTRIAPELFKQFPRQAKPGKDQYLIVSPKVKGVFRNHPPTRKIVPSEWFPVQPPTRQEILLFHEINQGGGPNIERIKKFRATPKFMGITLGFFGEWPHSNPTFACRDVELYKLKNPSQ